MSEIPKSVASKSVAGLFGSRVLTLPLAFASSLLVARLLGPHDRGILAFLNLFGTFVIPLTTLGFGSGTIYMVSTGKYKPSEVAATCTFFGIAQGAIAALVLLQLYRLNLLGSVANDAQSTSVLAFLALMPIQGATLLLCDLCYGSSQYRIRNLIALSIPGLTLFLLLIAVLWLRLGFGGVVLASVGGSFVVGILAQAFVWQLFRPVMRINWTFFRDALKFGLQAWVGDVSLLMNLRIDQVILGMVATPATLGCYSIAVTMAEFLWLIPDSVGPILFNKIAAIQNSQHARSLLERVHRLTILVTTASSFGLAIVGPYLLLLLFGSKFKASGILLLLLIPGSLCMTTAKIISRYIGATGFPKRSSFIQICGLIGGLFGYFLLIPAFGGIGAAIASSIGYIITACVALWIYGARSTQAISDLYLCKRLDIRLVLFQDSQKM